MTYKITQKDLAFKNDVESCNFHIPDFDHRAHLRLAYIYLVQTNCPSESVGLVRQALVGLLKHADVDPSVKYHETLTKAWLLAVHHFMHHTSNASSADDFIDQNPKLLDSKIMHTHYTDDVLFSESARTAFIEPNLEQIPRYAH
ncbi:hypothetical protein AB835_01980 [Candidatus Endobugula sertula]|uniref:Uncharacterized protein n=1 Tax=Candidatus Endobugula sertula TaxID=62101 RepID=A0A1D2QTC8_9GAMM|nr:hypothetical protein AB835_01980 [Candidatus Endobugula sertula]